MKHRPLHPFVLAAAFGLAACGGPTLPPQAPARDTTAAPAPQVVTDGPMKVIGAGGVLQMEGNMKAGKRDGVWTSFFANGRERSRSEYRDGKLQGIATVYRENGALYYTGQYRNDKEVGQWRFYDDQGNLLRTVEYDSTGAVINDREEAH